MSQLLRRVTRIIVAPGAEWQAIADEPPRAGALWWRFLFPLSLIPGVGGAAGLWLSSGESRVMHNITPMGFDPSLYGGLLAWTAAVLWIALSAVSLRLVVRLFGGLRDWARALQVAAYSATPLLLAGVLLVQPDLASILIIVFFHSLYLQYGGAQRVLQIKERDAAEYVALNFLLLSVLLTAVGAVTGWLGAP